MMRRRARRGVGKLLAVPLVVTALSSIPDAHAAGAAVRHHQEPAGERGTASETAKGDPSEEAGAAPEDGGVTDSETSARDSALGGEPGSGVPRETFGKVDPALLVAPLPRRARSPAETAALAEMERLFGRYDAASNATSDSLRDLLTIQGEQGRDAINKYYDAETRARAAKVRALRSKAVARYEEFLALHPNDPVWTPEIMLRLGQLLFESSSERFRLQEEAWEKELAAYREREDAGEKVKEAPAAPEADFSEAIAMFRRASVGFPDYANIDAALYMMGFLLLEQGDFDGARQSFLALGCSNRFDAPEEDSSNVIPSYKVMPQSYDDGCRPSKPDGRYVNEAWLRIGELHYDMDELDQALAAYQQAASDERNDFYDEALIRMAWTLYLRRDFAGAVTRLDEFVRYADKVKGTEEGLGTAELRDDAVKYIAKSYVEEDWDGDGRFDPVRGLARLDRDYKARAKEVHVPEIYAALGGLYAYQTDFVEAIEIWEETLRRWPTTRTAPDVQLRIMQAYALLTERDAAAAARDKLATQYLRGSEWFYANESDPDAIARGFELAEDALVATAVEHHEKAQAYRSEGDFAGAKREYLVAGKAYQAYLERFPNTESSYEYRFQYADSLYYSDQYDLAAQNYAEVRDSNIDNRLQRDAAEGVIFAFDAAMQEAVDGGELELPEMPKDGMEGQGPELKPQKLPPVVAALQRAYDDFIGIFPDSKSTAQFRYEAASLSQRYIRFNDSEARYVAILDNHCSQNIAINAGYAIIDAHVVRGDLEGTRTWTEELASRNCGSDEERARFAGELRTIGNAVRFQEAQVLFEAGAFEAAADRYVALVDEAPDDSQADRALNNAAVAYEEVGRFGSATRTYERIYTDYPDSEFADDALLRTGFNHARFFEYEQAVTKYLVLAEDERYATSEHRLIALKNAAALMENLQDYERAAELFRKWSEKSEDPNERAEGLFRAAVVTGKRGAHRATVNAYKRYLAKHGNDATEGPRAVEAQLQIGLAYEEMGRRKDADKAYRACVGEFNRRGLEPASEAAEFPAQAQFLLAERTLKDVLKVKISGTGKKMEKSVKSLFDRVLAASQAYDKVFPFRRLDWTLAGMYRRGFAFEDVAEKIRTAPVPKQLKEFSEPWFAYKDIVASEAQRFEDKSILLYEALIRRSAEFKVNTIWTRRARERLNKYKPEEFPLLRDAALVLQLEDLR